MDIQTATQFISQVGFPMFVAVFFLVKGSKDTQELKDAVLMLKEAITGMPNNKEVSK